MTFKQAIDNLDFEGKMGAKRPSMRGYAVVVPGPGEDLVKKNISLVAADGTRSSFSYGGGGVEKLEGEWKLDQEMMNALVFSDDWFISPADGLELSRTGGGGRM